MVVIMAVLVVVSQPLFFYEVPAEEHLDPLVF